MSNENDKTKTYKDIILENKVLIVTNIIPFNRV